jgi:hypothetical protein
LGRLAVRQAGGLIADSNPSIKAAIDIRGTGCEGLTPKVK